MAYSVSNKHKLEQDGADVPYEETPNGGGELRPLYLVFHYTAGRSLESSVSWFKNRDSKASAHLVIGRNGKVVQMQPFNKVCWHAGISKWGELKGLNNYSIGIEIDNAGLLKKDQAGNWKSWFGEIYPAADVIVAAHRLGGPERGWHEYTPVQIEAAIDIGVALHKKYGFADVLGHDDIAWPRKTDPGPAFPLASVQSRVMGRE